VARDAAGNSRTSSPVTVTVSNTTTTTTTTTGGSSGGGGGSTTTITPTTGTFVPTVTQKPAVLGYVSSGGCTAPQTATSTYSFKELHSLGKSSPEVKILQEILNANGYTVSISGPGSRGKETSTYGPATERAIKALQTKYRITPTGTVGSITRLVLSTLPYRASSSASCPTGTSTKPATLPTSTYVFTLALDLGSTGPEVSALQSLLSSLPNIYPEKLVTGTFGPLTAKAVGRFQELHNLAKPGDAAYGFVGPATRAKLNSIK
jgi:peptidoglycan hydrolase-like protein with peptidoglycan-binding domain